MRDTTDRETPRMERVEDTKAAACLFICPDQCCPLRRKGRRVRITHRFPLVLTILPPAAAATVRLCMILRADGEGESSGVETDNDESFQLAKDSLIIAEMMIDS